MTGHEFARRVFWWAGWYGIVVLAPQVFLERRIGEDYPPAITHPEFFYGFLGLGLAWQAGFLLIASDVARFRPWMLVGVLEKVPFGVAAVVLYAQGRLHVSTLVFGLIDLALAAAFLAAYRATRPRAV